MEGLIDELKNYHSLYGSLFKRQEQRHWVLKYMEGQLLAVKRKSIEPLAIHLNGGNIQAMQQYISGSPWNDEAIFKVHQQEIFKTLGEPATKLRLSSDSPASKRVNEVAIALTGSRWRYVIIQEGSKGPLEVEVAVLRVVTSRANLPARDDWLVVRRKSANQPISGWKFYRCNAPADTDWKTPARLIAGRWPIETTFEEGKGQLGIDHYEVRNWRGWHHHMTLTPVVSSLSRTLKSQDGRGCPRFNHRTGQTIASSHFT